MMRGKGMTEVSTQGPSHPKDDQDISAHRVSECPGSICCLLTGSPLS